MCVPRGMIFGRGGLEICQLHASRTDGRKSRETDRPRAGITRITYLAALSVVASDSVNFCSLGRIFFTRPTVRLPLCPAQNGGLFFPKLLLLLQSGMPSRSVSATLIRRRQTFD